MPNHLHGIIIISANYSDQNRRLTLYEGLKWQAIGEPRMHLEFTHHYFLASYSQRHDAYFSPAAYNAIGVGVDFDRQIFRLPTLILQATVQAVSQHGNWGPSFRVWWPWNGSLSRIFTWTCMASISGNGWITIRLMTAGASFRWRF